MAKQWLGEAVQDHPTAPNRMGSCSTSGDKCLKVRRHHTFHTTDPRVSVDVRHRKTTGPPCVLQRLKGYVETDLVSIFEEVSEGFCNTVDPHDLAFDGVSLNTFAERRSAKAHNLQGRVAKRGTSGPPVYGNPHLVRQLRADLVETQRREKTDGRSGRDGGDHS